MAAFDDYKDLLPSTRVYTMSELRKQTSADKRNASSYGSMTMSDRTTQYMAQMAGQHPQQQQQQSSPQIQQPASQAKPISHTPQHGHTQCTPTRQVPTPAFEDYMANQALGAIASEPPMPVAAVAAASVAATPKRPTQSKRKAKAQAATDLEDCITLSAEPATEASVGSTNTRATATAAAKATTTADVALSETVPASTYADDAAKLSITPDEMSETTTSASKTKAKRTSKTSKAKTAQETVVEDDSQSSPSHHNYGYAPDYSSMSSYSMEDRDENVVSSEMWEEYERSLASMHDYENDMPSYGDNSASTSASNHASSSSYNSNSTSHHFEDSADSSDRDGLRGAAAIHSATDTAPAKRGRKHTSAGADAAMDDVWGDNSATGSYAESGADKSSIHSGDISGIGSSTASEQGFHGDYGSNVDHSSSLDNGAEPTINAGVERSSASEEELDFSSIMEAYDEFQSDSDDDESYPSLRGKDLSSGRSRQGNGGEDSHNLYYPGIRATDSTADFTDEISPMSEGLPEDLRKFLKDRPYREEDTGPKFTELENQRAREAAEEHARITAEGHRRLTKLESTAQWNSDDTRSRRPATGIKYTRNSYMKPRGTEEREYYAGPRRDFGVALKELLDRVGIRIERIEDRNYQKLCFLQTRDGDRFKLSVFYNKRELVTFIQTSSELEDAKEAFNLLKNLAGSSIHNIQLKTDAEAEAYQQETERNSNKLLQRNKDLTLVDAKKAQKAVQNNRVDAKGSAAAGMGTVVSFDRRMHNILDPLGFTIIAITDKNYQKQIDLTSPSGNQLKLAVYYKGNDKISSFKFNKMPPEDMDALKLCLQSFEAQLLNTTLDLFKAKSMKRALHTRQ